MFAPGAPIEASVICSNYISATDSVVTADSSGECFFPAEPYSSYKVSLSASTSVGLGAVVSGIYRTDEGGMCVVECLQGCYEK